MNYSTAIFLISDKVRAVNVVFEKEEEHSYPKQYMFKTFDENIKRGDYVVVPSHVKEHDHGMSIAQVTEVDVEVDLESKFNFKWIIGIVSVFNFETIKAQEQEAISAIRSAEKNRKRKELRESLMEDAGEELKKLPIYDDGKMEEGEGTPS